MTALPPATDLTGASISEAQHKVALTALRAFLDENFSSLGGGQVIIGDTAVRTVGTLNYTFQITGTDGVGSVAAIQRFSADAAGGGIAFGKGRDAIGTYTTIVVDGDDLGTISAYGADGVDMDEPAAQIGFAVDGTPGAANIPGRIVFSTATGGTLAEKMRLDSTGQLGIGTTTPDGTLHVHTASAGAVTASTSADDLVVENTGTGGISILSGGTALIYFGDETSNLQGQVGSSTTGAGTDRLFLATTGGPQLGLYQSGGVTIDAAGGAVAPDGTLHVHTATAGMVTADVSGDDLVVENNGTCGISILTPASTAGVLMFGNENDPNEGQIYYTAGASAGLGFLGIIVAGSEKMRLDTAGSLFIGATANANMTVGLTIKGTAATDELFAAKDTDVGHAFTDIAEADTFFTIQKQTALKGGALLRGMNDDSTTAAMELIGDVGHATPSGNLITTTTASFGAVILSGRKLAVNADAAMVANENILAVQSAALTRFLIQGDGAIHATNVTARATEGGSDIDGTALDAEDDIGLLRVFERDRSNGMGIAMSKWDEQIKANEDDLKRIGVLSSEGDFYNMQRMNSLMGGAIWQLYTRLQDSLERITTLETKLLEN